MDIIVTKQKYKECLYYGDKGCEMWNELSMPMTDEVCNNFEDKI